ncbi:MAG: hypothetical protein IKL49_08005 [Lachnospiraceae bacterium]|nr:hypothetical protein [Lachnospiraceae bacterium]
MDNIVFAPVAIITLNRYEHLRRCVESLKKCKYAEETEVYISVDFPPNDSYQRGYLCVREYLKKEIDGFKKVHIFIQEKNLGVNGNSEFLKKIIFRKFDRYILSEDDNEFAYSFLEYMNKCLKMFEHDENVLNICGIQEDGPWKDKEDTIVFQQWCPAYGLGMWREKERKLEKIEAEYFKKYIPKDKNKMKLLYKTSKICFQQFGEGVLWGKENIFWGEGNRPLWCDTLRSIYAICEGKCFVAPKVSKVCNHGFDGSGVNIKRKNIDPCMIWELDTSEKFNCKYIYNIDEIRRNTQYKDKGIYQTKKIFVLKAQIKIWIYNIIYKNN